jgi:hypothetical protein
MRPNRFVRWCITGLAASTAVLAVPVGTGHAHPQVKDQASTAEIFSGSAVNRGSDDGCLDLGSYAFGAPAVLGRCHFLSSQRWSFGDDGTIRSIGAGSPAKCLDVGSYDEFAVVQLFRCHGLVSQRWALRGNYALSNVGSANKMCMDIRSYDNGTPVQLYRCNGAESQIWDLVPS